MIARGAERAVSLRVGRSDRGEVAVLELAGRLDTPLERVLTAEVRKLCDRGRYRVIVDCGGLAYLSSRGVSVFIAALDELREGGGDLKLARVTPQGALVLDRLGVTHLVQRFDSVEEAVLAFATPIAECLSHGGLDTFVAASGGAVFHASGCRSVAKIRTVRTFASKKEGREAGLRPCRKCIGG